MAQNESESENTEKSSANRWVLPLTFVFMTVPFLSEVYQERRDCYQAPQDCEKDWGGGGACEPRNEPTCQYVGRAYHSWFGHGSSSRYSRGFVSRGGFGGAGRGFSSGA